jgi:hypothetical protein
VMRNIATSLILGLSLSITACAADKADVDDDFSSLAGLDDKSDAFSYRMKIVGSLEYGENSGPVIYTSNPRYRAFKFAGGEGDQVIVDVKAAASSNGDAVTWILDNDFNVIAFNDDATSTNLNSHIEITLPANESRTHYIVFRDYHERRRTFTVGLQGTPAVGFRGCQKDVDCVKIQDGCCGMTWTAVRGDSVQSYLDSLGCPENVICPAVLTRSTDDEAYCDNNTHQCELVDPSLVRCGGHSINMHGCPDGFECVGDALAYDGTGNCRKFCGGFANLPCQYGYNCQDNPFDDCDVNNGGADCGGLCFPPTCGGFGNLQCQNDGQTCVDDTTDSCDVNDGGADCGSICVNY